MNKKMITGIIYIAIGVILMAVFGAIGNYHIQIANKESAKNNKEEIIDNQDFSKKEILKNLTKSLPIEKDPILYVDMGGKGIHLVEYNPPYFRIDIRSNDAGSTNFNIKSYLLIVFNNGTYSLEEPLLFDKDTKISNTSLASVPLSKTTQNVKELYLYITGTYSNLNLSKNYKVNDVYQYQSYNKETRGIGFQDKQRIIDLIYKNKEGKLK